MTSTFIIIEKWSSFLASAIAKGSVFGLKVVSQGCGFRIGNLLNSANDLMCERWNAVFEQATNPMELEQVGQGCAGANAMMLDMPVQGSEESGAAGASALSSTTSVRRRRAGPG